MTCDWWSIASLFRCFKFTDMTSKNLSAIPSYVFWELDSRRAALRAAGRTLIDVGIGSPDGPIPPVVIEAMQRAAAEPALSAYPYFRGHPDYFRAITRYLDARFSVSIDPTRELMAVAGSNDGLAELVLK